MNTIERGTKYWVIRSGIEAKCFENFYQDKCVALGWDKIAQELSSDTIVGLDAIKEYVVQKYGEILDNGQKSASLNRRIGDIASKIYKFVYEVQDGDIILTPGEREVLIGRISGGTEIINGKYNVEQETAEEKLLGQLNKVRKVEWLRRVNRDMLEPNIRLCLRVMHGISLINQEQVITEINREIYDLYEYGEETHSIYRIRNQEEIDFIKYATFIKCIKDVYDILSEDKDEKLLIKTNVQSPGPVELIGKNVLINNIILATGYLLKNDDTGMERLGKFIQRIKELKEKSYNSIADDEYIDYDFPVGGTY